MAEAQKAALCYPELAEAGQEPPSVSLVEYDENAQDKVVSAILFPRSHAHLQKIKELVLRMSNEEKERIIQAYVGERKNRRHKPGRA
ncbi:MAG: thymidylate synthase, partial [Candidatus Micrarchaeota archaeon]|nr:thymidylate synthase [Candidatus Micrarchaeota archaeon]